MQKAKDSTVELVELLDGIPLNGRYWTTMGLLALILAVDFFDFFIVGFLIAVLGPQWNLTFGQSSCILLSGGVGAIVGALVVGGLSDALGRKLSLVLGTLVCGMSAGAIAFLPEGAWQLFTLFRFGVGFGLAGVTTPTIALIVEYTPTRYRTVLPSLLTVFATLGTLLASATAAVLLSVLGWRGVAALGMTPVLLSVLVVLLVPESIRWLLAKGRIDDARRTISRVMHVPLNAIPTPTTPPVSVEPIGFSELYAERRRFWLTVIIWTSASAANYGVYLWGPTVVALLLGVNAQEAAHYFVYVALAGIVGKIAFSVLPHWVGRRPCGLLGGAGIAASLAAAALFFDTFHAGIPLFIVLLAVGALFYDGLFASISPYAAELFPVRMAARGVGLAQAANGIGKILGPLALALIAGTGNFVAPKATADAVTPAFLFLATCGAAIFLAFLLIPIETRGRPLVLRADSQTHGNQDHSAQSHS